MSTTIPQAASSGAVEELDNSDYSPPAEISPRGDIEAKQLPIWLRNDILDWHTLRLFEKIDRAKKTRACHWPDKTKDGTKGDLSFDEKQAFPWRGAVDTESRIVDEVINEEVDLAIQTWFSGEKIVRPRDVMDDDGQRRSQAWRHVLDFELDQSESERVDALELLWNSVEEITCGVRKEGWERRTRKGKKTLEFQQLVQATIQDAAEAAQTNYVPFTEDDAAAIEGMLLVARDDKESKDELIQRIQGKDSAMSASEAAQVLKQWRKGITKAEYYAPIPEPGIARPRALVPGVDCIFPGMMQNHKHSRFWEFEWLTEAEVKTRAEQEDWDKEWTTKLLNNPGLVVDWRALGITNYTGQWLNGIGVNYQLASTALRNAGMYQIATLWNYGVSDGMTLPYKCVCHGQIEGYATLQFDPYADGDIHLRLVRRENKSNIAVDGLGVPDELITQQVAEKQTVDLFCASAQLRGMPPRFKTMEESGDGLQPGALIPANTRMLQHGNNLFPALPDPHSQHVLSFLEWNRKRVDSFYKRGAESDPDLKRTRRLRKMFRASMFYKEMLHLLAMNVQRDIGDDGIFIGSVNGQMVNQLINADDLQGRLDVVFHCDTAATDLELAKEKIQLTTQVVSLFRNGEVDFGQVGRNLLSWVDARLVSVGVRDQQAAYEHETEELIQKIASGILVIDPKNPLPPAGDPQLRIQLLQQWTSLPQNQQLMMQQPMAREQIFKLMEHYQFQITQYQDNAAIGRTWGVNPQMKSLEDSNANAQSQA